METNYVELIGIGESRLSKEDINIDDLERNEVVVKAKYSLISAGTELSRAFGLKQGFKYPVRPGYSLVGEIIKKGDGLDFEIGDRVFVNAPHASIVRWKMSDDVQGPFILPIDKDIDSLEATAINLLLVALQGVNLAEVKLGYKVGIFGLGSIGIFTALMFKKLGMDVIGLDVVKQRCDLACELGLKHVSSDNDQIKVINEFTNNQGLDIAVDVTGLSPVIMTAINVTRSYGQTILLGSPRQSYESDITPILSEIHMKNLKVIGAFNKTTPLHEVNGSHNSLFNNYQVVSDLLINKDIEVNTMISKIVDPKDCKQAYYDLMYNKDSTNLVVFDWNNY